MTEKPNTPRKHNRKGGKPRKPRSPRTIGTNVGQAIRDAQAAQEATKRKSAASIARKIAEASK